MIGKRAAVSAALFIALGAPAPAQSRVSTGTLAGGGSYTINADAAQPAAAVALWYRAPAAGFQSSPLPGLARLAAATVAGSVPLTGSSLSALVASFGGRLTVAAYPDSVAVTALVPASHAAAAVKAMTADFFAPVVTAAGLELAKRDLVEEALYRSFDAQQSLEDALGATLFASGPLHDGVAGTAQGLREATLAQVSAFAERAFRPGNAALILTGNVGPEALAGAASREGALPASEPPSTQTLLPAPLSLRRTGNAEGVGLAWAGPPIADEASATALDFLADALFAPRRGLVSKALGESAASVSGKFVTYRDPGIFEVTVSGEGVPAARAAVERAIAAAATPMDPATFAALRAAFVYDVLAGAVTPGDVADSEGWYAVEGNPAYAPTAATNRGRYLSLAAALTPQSVARTAARYLSSAPGSVTLSKAAGTAAPKGNS